MNMRITDLMDYYRGEPVKALLESGGFEKPAPAAKPESISRGRKPLMIAAALLLLVTTGIGLTFFLSRTPGGTALEQGTKQPESVSETVSPEVPAVVPGSSAEEAGMTAEPDYVEPYVIEGSLSSGDVWDNACCGNLLYIDNLYYTLTDNGPEQVELQNLTATVELLGSVWNINVDYAVIDGELAFHDNLCKLFYAEVDGETVYRGLYDPERTDIEWTDPKAVTVRPLEGSTDTVVLTIEDTYLGDYACLYNLATGEVTDPFAGVPGLWENGRIQSITYNSTFTYALVWTEERFEVPYLCDLTTGELTSVVELFHTYTPGTEADGVILSANGTLYWADEDTLLFYEQEMEMPVETPGEAPVSEGQNCLHYYNVKTGELECQFEVSQMDRGVTEDIYGYRICELGRDKENGNDSYRVIDAENETVYALPGHTGYFVSGGDGRSFLSPQNEAYQVDGFYMVDMANLEWADLSEYIAPAELWKDFQPPTVVSNRWLVYSRGENLVYCYRIPDNLPMIPMEAK